MSFHNIKISNERKDGDISLGSSNEQLRNRAILASVVASAAAGVLSCDLAFMGFVTLGIVSLPFTWPVLIGISAGAAIVGVVALAIFYSSKNKMVEVVGDVQKAAEISAQERFTLQAKAACRNLRSGEMLNDNTVQFVVLAMSVLYDRECNLTLSQGKAFQDYNIYFVQPVSKEKPSLQIRAVCIEGQGLVHGVYSRLQQRAGYIENHATGFIGNEYFDPKGLSYRASSQLKEPITQKTVREIGGELRREVVDYPHAPVQDFFDTTSCGVHVCRRIQQYFMGTEGEPLAPLNKQQIAGARENFASWIEDYIINENTVQVSYIALAASSEDVSLNPKGDDF